MLRYGKQRSDLGRLTMGNAAVFTGSLIGVPESLVEEKNRRYNKTDYAS